MRNVVGISAVLLICILLSSCSGNKPEKSFMGTWEGTYEGNPVELAFMEKGTCIGKEHGKAYAGTWIINPEGNAVITFENDSNKFTATLMKDGKILLREGGASSWEAMLEKSDSKER